MIEVAIDKLPGGDRSRRQNLARIEITNTGLGTGGVKLYDACITHVANDRGSELAAMSCRTYRETDEGVLRVIHRALGKMLGLPDAQ